MQTVVLRSGESAIVTRQQLLSCLPILSSTLKLLLCWLFRHQLSLGCIMSFSGHLSCMFARKPSAQHLTAD